ncbi:MAG: alpha/beta fold hydrolase [Anaerolineales bacterium]|nr:alpha/beta fold hydrolase [Anaerolineales bacterium]
MTPNPYSHSRPKSSRRLRGLKFSTGVLIVSLFLPGCLSQGDQTLPNEVPTKVTPSHSPSITSSPTPTITPIPSPTPTVTISPTPDPFSGLTIEDLAKRSYGGGQLSIEETLSVNTEFTRVLFSYPSDELQIYGFMNVPHGEGPFPVVLVLHGYVTPANYQTLAYTRPYADAIARAGFLVLHPNYRNHPPSEEGDNPFRVGYTIDVLNLIHLVQEQGGQPGPLEAANPLAVGLFGHSMGGGIAIRAITINPEVKAAVLYGAMSADEQKNYEKILQWSDGRVGQEELETPEEDFQRISPVYHLEHIRAAVSIHHGGEDAVVPREWSSELCSELTDLNKNVECFDYPDQPHSFSGEDYNLFIQRVLEFFQLNLKDSQS